MPLPGRERRAHTAVKTVTIQDERLRKGRATLARAPIRLIAIDLDGTLLDSHWQVPEANRRAIERAIERGIHIVLVTGRRFSFTRTVTEQLHDNIALIVNNGALIKSPEGATLLRRLLPRDVARAVVAATREYRPSTALVFDRPEDSQVVFEHIDWNDPGRRAYFERNRQYLKEICPLEDSLTEDPIQVMYTGPVAEMRRLVATLRSLPFSGDFSIAVAEYKARDFTIVDVIEHSCSKGSSLKRWAEHLGIRREEILAIGDNLNDREMLDFAGQAVVMGNASEELKTLGWPVTLSNDDGGVAAAIDRYVLAEPQR
jgi:Cof subfamily protein (haloacid dehalogenase superfamily)